MAELHPALFFEQSAPAAVDLNGVAPATTATTTNRREVLPPHATNNGLFSFGDELKVVDEIRVFLTGGSAYTVKVVDQGGREQTIGSGSALSNVDVIIRGPYILGGGEKIKVTTTGAAGINAPFARVTARKWASQGNVF